MLGALMVVLLPLVAKAQDPAANLKVGPQPDGSVLVPSNQLLRPAGRQIEFPGRPVDLCLTKDGKALLIKNSGSLDLIRIADGETVQSLPWQKSGASFTGLCVSGDGSTVYATDAEDLIEIAALENGKLHHTGSITLPGPPAGGPPVPGGLALDREESMILVTLSRNNSLGVVDLGDMSIAEIPTGIAPFDVLIFSPSKVYVSNRGGRRPQKGEPVYNTSGSQVLVDSVTGIANHGSISVVDPAGKKQIKDIEVGLHPTDMILSPDKTRLYVACTNSDIITVIDTKTDEVSEEISVRIKTGLPFGSAPNALAFSPDGKYLYVANGTDNAICVIRTGSHSKVMGYIPAGWYPGSVATGSDGKYLYVANVKGIGSRNKSPDKKGFNSHNYLGTVSVIPVPSARQLKKMTGTVSRNNNLQDLPGLEKSIR